MVKREKRRFSRRFELQCPAEPNLLREIFPYTDIPRIRFDGVIVPMSIPEDYFITDTTFRDGQQARPPYSPEQIQTIYNFLHKLGGPRGVIRQCEFFLYTEKDRRAVRLCQDLGYESPEITGWIRAVEKDLDLVREMGLGETGILTSASDYHIYRKLNLDRRQAMEQYLRIVRSAIAAGVRPRCHFEDVTRADFYGFVVPFAQALMEIAEEAEVPVRIRLCDTLGFGLPYPEAALPRSVPKLIHGLTREAGVPGEWLEWHGHNDFHRVSVNALTAWLYGCAAVNATCLGFGERTGNPPLEAAVIDYMALRGDDHGMDTRVITDIARYFERETKVRIPAGYPFVGAEFNSTSAGIHADGVEKFQEIYNPFDTVRILNRPIGITVNDKSGAAGVALWLKLNLGIELDKRDPRLHPIVRDIQRQYETGRLTAMGGEELRALARYHLPDLVATDLDVLKQRARHLAGELIEVYRDNEDVRSMVAERVERVLQEIIDRNEFVQYCYVVNGEGRKLTRNVFQAQFQDKYSSWSVEDFSDREWFKAPMRDGRIHVSNLYTSRVTGELCITVSSVILDMETEEPCGVMGMDIRFEDLLRHEV
ncbi:MAG: histone-lysine N-methyltransferase [Planctomycetes bacterium]|nr:histone-lysine N-methyltransferase [Planctomycetota bacterium]